MEHIKVFIIGIILGVANVIPGVSAGTMAVSLNVYDKMLDAISLKKEKFKKNFPFIFFLGIGIISGIMFFSSIIKYLYTYYDQQTNFFFMGVILGSIPIILKKAAPSRSVTNNQKIAFVITLLLLVSIHFIQRDEATQEILTTLTLSQGIYIFVCGIVAAFTMIIPGISGSFMLLVMGSYATVVSAVSDRNITIIAVVGLGCLVGLLGGAKIVKVLLRDYKEVTYASILGLVVGSVISLYPGFAGGIKGILLIGFLLLGAIISYTFSKE